MEVILRAIVPVFSIVAIGYILGFFKNLDTKTLSELTLYLLTPGLVFTSLIESQILLRRLLSTVAFAGLIFAAVALVSWILARALHYSPSETSSFVLSTTLMNCGNLGLPLVYFAFGNEGLAIAVIFLVCFVIILNTFGIFTAAGGHLPASQAFREIYRLPALYAIALALVIKGFHWSIPVLIWKPVQMIGHAAIPIILIVLGIQLTHANFRERLGRISLSVAIRLILSPILALLIFAILPADALTRRVLIIQSSGPTAVNAVILATKYDTHPEFVSGVILISTVLSIFTLSILLGILG